jgi:hypothetical protein
LCLADGPCMALQADFRAVPSLLLQLWPRGHKGAPVAGSTGVEEGGRDRSAVTERDRCSGAGKEAMSCVLHAATARRERATSTRRAR